jgi:hypothetical protein
VKTVSRVLTAIFALLLIGFAATVLQRKRLA